MKKVRILHIITRLDKGGSAETTLLSASLMNMEKYEVSLICGLSLESGMSPEEKVAVEQDKYKAMARGVKIFIIPSLVRRISLAEDIQTLISIYRLIKKIRPHIVHTHTSKAGGLGRLAAYLARVPVIIHTPHGHVFHSYYGFITTKSFILTEKILSFITDKITALTENERDEHLEEGIASRKKYTVIHSGVDLASLMNMKVDINARKQELGIPRDSNVIGTVGRLVPIKGHKYLVSAAEMIIREFPDTCFVFVGDGHLKSVLERQAESIGVRKNIIFTGWMDDSSEIISLFDVFVLPSLNEGMGRVLIEAMAMGKPIVASNVGGIISLVKNGENGILSPPRDPVTLGKAILQLIKDRELAERLGSNGKAMIYPAFDTSVMIKKIEDLYEGLLSNLSSPDRQSM